MNFCNAWANAASVLSLAISFLAAIWAYFARRSARLANAQLKTSVVIHNLALAIGILGEIPRLLLHKDVATRVLVSERCTVLEQALLEIQGMKIPEAEAHQVAIMIMIRQVQILKDQVNSRLGGRKVAVDWEQFNAVAGREAGKLVQLKSTLLYNL
jgi:hypothetical protein